MQVGIIKQVTPLLSGPLYQNLLVMIMINMKLISDGKWKIIIAQVEIRLG